MESTATSLTVERLLAEGQLALSMHSSARLDAELLLAYVLGCPRSTLLRDDRHTVTREQQAQFLAFIARRALGEPLAYLTGEREFWSLPLQVTPAVLVPRPETELIVERALVLLDHAEACVADLGTGSGAIALALASERPRWRITATDQSAEALRIAAHNAQALGITTIRFVQGDWFKPLAGERFDLIASNPPYIAAGHPALQDAALQHEPLSALASGPAGLDALLEIIQAAAAHLRAGGFLLLEHGSDQAGRVADALTAAGFGNVRCHQDLAGHDRVSEARAAGS
jgi:release factor glutamine methyltransferase